MRHLKLISRLLATLAVGAFLGSAAMARAGSTSTRYLVFFEPGPTWDYGSGMKLQAGYSKHVIYFRKLFKQKKVTMVGTVKGQKLILALGPKGADKLDMKTLAQGDPLVKSGALKFSVREWKLDFEGKEKAGYSEEDELSDVDLEDY